MTSSSSYRASYALVDWGWIDLNFECSTVCSILLGLMGFWQKRLGKMGATPKSKSTKIQVHVQRGHPALMKDSVTILPIQFCLNRCSRPAGSTSTSEPPKTPPLPPRPRPRRMTWQPRPTRTGTQGRPHSGIGQPVALFFSYKPNVTESTET